jgi:ribosome-binding ATPase
MSAQVETTPRSTSPRGRAEVIGWNDVVACGSHTECSCRSLQRLEGESYVVADGDVLNIRFNV